MPPFLIENSRKPNRIGAKQHNLFHIDHARPSRIARRGDTQLVEELLGPDHAPRSAGAYGEHGFQLPGQLGLANVPFEDRWAGARSERSL